MAVRECSKDYVILTWESPESDGGSEILQFVIEKRDVTRGLGTWMVCGTVGAEDHAFRVIKLFQGNAYQFRVSAENRVGVGTPIETTEPVIAQLPYGRILFNSLNRNHCLFRCHTKFKVLLF